MTILIGLIQMTIGAALFYIGYRWFIGSRKTGDMTARELVRRIERGEKWKIEG